MTNQNLNTVFHALADPTRRAVLARLLEGDAPVKSLAAPYQMALPTFLKHLSVLEGAELITTRKTGRTRICTANPQTLQIAEKWFTNQRALWENRLDNLGAYLARTDGKDT